MEYMESMMQQQYEAGEAQMERASDVYEKLKLFCKENDININEITDSIELVKRMGWETIGEGE